MSRNNVSQITPPMSSIISSYFKDEEIKSVLFRKLFSLLEDYFPIQQLQGYIWEMRLLVNSAYYLMSTLINRGTLGEEHSGIKLVFEGDRVPDSIRRIVLYLLSVCLPYIFNKLHSKVQPTMRNYIQNVKSGDNRRSTIIGSLFVFLHSFLPDDILKTCQLLHLSRFFIRGKYIEVGKRVMGAKYIMKREIGRGIPYVTYKLVGRIMTFQYIVGVIGWMIGLMRRIYNHWRTSRAPSHQDLDLKPNSPIRGGGLECPICFAEMKNISSTTCGHLFCWHCIITALAITNQCPTCRTINNPQDILLIANLQ